MFTKPKIHIKSVHPERPDNFSRPGVDTGIAGSRPPGRMKTALNRLAMLPYLLLIIGFILLIKGADLLVEGASAIARRMNISDLVIGLTVVAFGTSMPELFVNLFASVSGSSGIAIGNVLGSNIANILLILGVSAMISPLRVSGGTVYKEIPFSLLAALVLGIIANDQIIDHRHFSEISRTDGMVLLCFFLIFIYYSASIAHKVNGMETYAGTTENGKGVWHSGVRVAAGLVGLGLGGQWIVGGAVHMARALGMSEALVGLTIVSVGTSLPELATSAVAAYKKNADIAVGNIVGSNIFNIFFVLGISACIRPLPFQKISNMDIAAVIIASLILFSAMFTGRRHALDRWEGATLVALYLVYIVYLVMRG